jgi:hypothetical protein
MHVDACRPAKNSSLYQLKDCPWAFLRPFAREEGYVDEKQDTVSQVAWSATSLWQANTVEINVECGERALAIDKSSSGEIAVSVVKLGMEMSVSI